jgi:DNA-binding transcriptional ArsR family regulator
MRDRPCATFFEVLSTKSRLDILIALYDGAKSVTAIAERVKTERTNISHQLRILHECSFVFMRKSGRKRIYSLNMKTVKPIFDLAEEHVENFCKHKKEKCEKKQE